MSLTKSLSDLLAYRRASIDPPMRSGLSIFGGYSPPAEQIVDGAGKKAYGGATLTPGKPVSTADWNLDKAITDGWGACVWVYACVARLADQASSVPWRVMRLVGDKWEPDPTDPRTALIEYPNQSISRKWQHYFLVLQYLLRGNALAQILTDAKGQNPELLPLMTANFDPVPGKDVLIESYQERTGDRRKFPREEIVHTALPSADSLLWGSPPLKPLANVVAADVEAVLWNKAQLKNQGVPPFALIDPMIADDEGLKEARNRLKERVTGALNAREPIVLGGRDVTIQQLAQTAVEADWLEGQRFNLLRIVAAYGLRPALFSLEAATDNNMDSAERHSWSGPTTAILDAMEDAYNLRLLKREERATKWIHYDLSSVSALQRDLAGKIPSYAQAVGAGISPNAAARMLNLGIEQIPGGDEPLISAALVKLSDLLTPPDNAGTVEKV